MRPVKQRYHSADSKVQFGDCLRACIATVLELPAEEVPHVRHGAREGDAASAAAMWAGLRQWLQPRGLNFLSIDVPAKTLAEALAWTKARYGDSHLILGGEGPGGQGHAVVICEGAVVHDPASTSGKRPALVGPIKDDKFAAIAFVHRPDLLKRVTPTAAAIEADVPMPPMPDLSLLDQHERIALSFSGGKDSLALIHLLKPRWHKLRVYHVNTQDLLPETVDIVRAVEAMVPNWCEITTNPLQWQERFGLVSDVTTYDCSPMGRAALHGYAGRMDLVDRMGCCRANLAQPLATRLAADGITLSIRGTRRQDPNFGWMLMSGGATSPTTFQDGPLTYWLPIVDWSVEQVFKYLRSVGAPIARYYAGEFKHSGPECARCTAWLDEGRAKYLRKFHPAIAADYFVRLSRVRSAVRPTLQQLEAELDALTAPATQ